MKKESEKFFIGELYPDVEDFFKVKFLRRQGKSRSFRFPNIDDVSVVAKSQILAILNNVSCRRNIYTFSEIGEFPFNIE